MPKLPCWACVLLKVTERGSVWQRVLERCGSAYSTLGDLGWGGGMDWWVRRLWPSRDRDWYKSLTQLVIQFWRIFWGSCRFRLSPVLTDTLSNQMRRSISSGPEWGEARSRGREQPGVLHWLMSLHTEGRVSGERRVPLLTSYSLGKWLHTSCYRPNPGLRASQLTVYLILITVRQVSRTYPWWELADPTNCLYGEDNIVGGQ